MQPLSCTTSTTSRLPPTTYPSFSFGAALHCPCLAISLRAACYDSACPVSFFCSLKKNGYRNALLCRVSVNVSARLPASRLGGGASVTTAVFLVRALVWCGYGRLGCMDLPPVVAGMLLLLCADFKFFCGLLNLSRLLTQQAACCPPPMHAYSTASLMDTSVRASC